MQQAQIGEKAKLLWQRSHDAFPIQINPSHHLYLRIIQSPLTEHSLVAAADVLAYPGLGDVLRVVRDGPLPCLQRDIGVEQSVVFPVQVPSSRWRIRHSWRVMANSWRVMSNAWRVMSHPWGMMPHSWRVMPHSWRMMPYPWRVSPVGFPI